jgi:class 3 adenylate cyclase
VISPPTGEVTFFFTDIQGSTRLWERDAKRMQLALARHDEILKGVVEGYGGYVFKMIGDACCAAFSSAPKALEAALSAQWAIFSEPWDEECRVAFHLLALARDYGEETAEGLRVSIQLTQSGPAALVVASRVRATGFGILAQAERDLGGQRRSPSPSLRRSRPLPPR